MQWIIIASVGLYFEMQDPGIGEVCAGSVTGCMVRKNDSFYFPCCPHFVVSLVCVKVVLFPGVYLCMKEIREKGVGRGGKRRVE